MSNKEQEFWERFKEKYGERYKRISKMTSSGAYVDVAYTDVAMFEKEQRAFIVGDIAEYIYDLEDIKEDALIMAKKYNKLLKRYKKLKEQIKWEMRL